MLLAAWLLIGLPVILGAYAYVGYPLILGLLPRHATRREPPAPAPLPTVSIVIPAYNEEHQIAGAVEAAIAQDYPASRKQILVLSDASTDRTDDIVRSYADRGVELLRMPSRMGKTAAENFSIASIRGDIVVNTDSSVRLHPQAVSRLVAEMADPTVGVASTVDVSLSERASANAAEAAYVGYEMRIRELETRTGGIIGASGSGYAIRARLHALPVRHDLSRDFSAALTAQRHGLRAVSVPGAICFVPRTGSLRVEYRRKVRTIARGMDTLAFNSDLLDFTNHGSFSWKLLSHKVCRWLVPLVCPLALVGTAMLATRYLGALWLLAAGILALSAAILFSRWPDRRPLPKVVMALAGALSGNLAVIHAAWRFVAGHHDHLWEPTRRTVALPTSVEKVDGQAGARSA